MNTNTQTPIERSNGATPHRQNTVHDSPMRDPLQLVNAQDWGVNKCAIAAYRRAIEKRQRETQILHLIDDCKIVLG